MKLSRRIVSVIVVAAVLAGTGVVGLLIHRARTGHRTPVDTAAARDIQEQRLAMAQQRPGSSRPSRETPEERAKRREERAQILKKMASLTEEEKAQFREQIHAQVSGRGAHALSPDQERALRAQLQAGLPPAGYRQALPVGPGAAEASPEPNAAGTEPNAAGQH
jgi:hypothetical protein